MAVSSFAPESNYKFVEFLFVEFFNSITFKILRKELLAGVEAKISRVSGSGSQANVVFY